MILQRLREYLRRSTFGKRIGVQASSFDLVRLGSEYGGWWVPRFLLSPGTVAYCAGAGEDVTFDVALLEHGCVVRTIDPTPRAVEHVQQTIRLNRERFGFAPVALWSHSTQLRLYVPYDPTHVSHSAVNLQNTSEYIDVEAMAIEAMISHFGDDHVDLVKLDIEGAELVVLPDVVRLEPKPTAICVEFDDHSDMPRVRSVVSDIREQGYVAIKAEGYNILFLHTPGARIN